MFRAASNIGYQKSNRNIPKLDLHLQQKAD